MKPLILALQFMTRLPLPAVRAESSEMAAAIRWFPVAGLVVGACVAGGAWLGLRHDPWAGALLALFAWVGVTGALHLDGLGDIADAAGAGHADRSRISEVLADPHIGSFGVIAIGLQLLSKLVLLRLAMELPSTAVLVAALVSIPAIARTAPMFWSLTLPPLHLGLGSTFRSGATWPTLACWAAILFAVAVTLSPALLAALPATVAWRWWLLQRIGGISGDGHGAGIEIVETVTLAALVFGS